MIKTWAMGAFGGGLTGLGFKIGTDLFSLDSSLELHEFLILVITIPVLITFLTRKIFGSKGWIILPVCYLTIFIPVLGPSFGGSGSEPIWAFLLLGCIGGLAWITPIALWTKISSKKPW